MFYNLRNEKEKKDLIERVKKVLAENKDIVEFTVKRQNRTLSQNNYLHLLLSYFASHFGYSQEEVKERFFKMTVNPDLFVQFIEHDIYGKGFVLRSTTELDTKQMTIAINRFKNYSADADLILPDANNDGFIYHALNEIENYAEYI